MAITAKIRGTTRVGDTAATPLVDKPISSDSPTVTDQQVGEKLHDASSSTTLNMGGVTNATYVDLSFFDADTGDPKECGVKFNTMTEDFIDMIRFIFVGNDNSNGITSISIETQAGNKTLCKYVIVGT